MNEARLTVAIGKLYQQDTQLHRTRATKRSRHCSKIHEAYGQEGQHPDLACQRGYRLAHPARQRASRASLISRKLGVVAHGNIPWEKAFLDPALEQLLGPKAEDNRRPS